jgi:inosose dehydratase
VRVASTPFSFGIFDAGPGLPDPLEVLDAIAETGYEGTELGPLGYFGAAPETAAALEERGLALVGVFLPMRLSRKEHTDEAFAILDRALGALDETTPPGDARPVVLISDAACEPDRLAQAGRIEELRETWLGPARFALLAETAQRAAERCVERGYGAAFHYHLGSYVETPREIDRFAEMVDFGVLGFCFDSGHSLIGGGDPVAFLDTYGELVSHVHLKDVDGTVRSEIRACRFGDGDVELAAIVQRLRSIGYSGWVVAEEDRRLDPGQTIAVPTEDALHNREVLRELGV